jgi:hypothetical protein
MGKAPPAFQWSSHDFQSNTSVPMAWQAPGCYAIFLDGELVYIGQSERVRGRLWKYQMHLNIFADARGPGIVTPWGSAFVVTIKFKRSRRYGDWLMREARLIRKLQPRGNTIGVRKQVANG